MRPSPVRAPHSRSAAVVVPVLLGVIVGVGMACAEAPPPETAGVVAASRADAATAARVLARMAVESTVDVTQVTIDVRDGVVTLSGATDPEALRRARRVARHVPGVVRVDGVEDAAPGDGSADARPAVLIAPIAARLGAARVAIVPEGSGESTGSGGGERHVADATSPPATDEAVIAGSGEGSAGPRTYTVAPGETLGRVAEKTLGSARAWRRIYDVNRDVIGPNPERVRDGMVLRIPGPD